jgi:hypothetical protein
MFTRRPITYKPGDSEKWQRMYEEYHKIGASDSKKRGAPNEKTN